jgi:hypothetical protein
MGFRRDFNFIEGLHKFVSELKKEEDAEFKEKFGVDRVEKHKVLFDFFEFLEHFFFLP